MGGERGRPPKDRISNLPDELLVGILCVLSMKDAIRTTALSSRWKHLWNHYSSCINFETLNVVARILKTNWDVCDDERYFYCKFVNRILNSLKSPTIDEFKVVFNLNKNYATDIDKWIHFALVERTGLQKLELNFAPNYAHIGCFPSPAFPARLLDMEIRCFETLTVLRFASLDITDHILALFISKCPFLEHLSVAYARSLLHVKVVGTPSLKLKHFEINNCHFIKDVEISSATNLVSFKWYGKEMNGLHFKNVPCLTQVSFGDSQSDFLFRRSNEDLSFYHTQMGTLILDFNRLACIGDVVFSERLPKFSNLKHLVVKLFARDDQSLLFLTSLIYYASPLLATFTLKVLHRPGKCYGELRECVWRDEGKKHPHESLKVVEFIGWGGFEHEFQLANYLLENTLLLEKIIIHAREFQLYPEELEHIFSSSIYNEEAARKRAKQLEAKVPPGVGLIIL